MNENTKKDLKDSFETAVIVVLCILFVTSMNRKCSNALQKSTRSAIENTQNAKKQMTMLQKVR